MSIGILRNHPRRNLQTSFLLDLAAKTESIMVKMDMEEHVTVIMISLTIFTGFTVSHMRETGSFARTNVTDVCLKTNKSLRRENVELKSFINRN